jgi:hypothetical protein
MNISKIIDDVKINENENNSNDSLKENKKKKNKLWNKPYKVVFYEEQRIELINQLSILLNLNDDNNIVFVEQMNDLKIKEFIEVNEDKIKLYFDTRTWSFFKKNREETRLISALLKNIYKHEKYTIFSKKGTLKDKEGKSHSSYKYIFFKPNSIIK